MASQKQTKIWLKRIAIITFIAMLVIAGWLWYIFSRKFENTSETKPDYVVNTAEFIHEFEVNDSGANKKFSEKIITVNGIISEMEAADTSVNLKMSDSTSGSYIIFAFQNDHIGTLKQLKAGDDISVKGSCSGGTRSEILDLEYITFKRCVVTK